MVERVSTAFEKLTPREREILRLIAAHLQSKEIARALGLSPKTVEMHVLSARRRLSGMSRRDAALAFVAWEGGDPGSDYRRQPDDLAALPAGQLSDREIEGGRGGLSTLMLDTHEQDWRHQLSGFQWLGLVLGVTAAIAVALAAIAIGMDALIMAIQRITHY
jgi:DNA-binding CsgD family transcriptional regulator